MGTDYYRCDNCDLQVNDCMPYDDVCNGCGIRLCWNCTATFGIRDKPIDYEEAGKPLNGEYKMVFSKYAQDDGEDPDEAFYAYELLNCPFCEAKNEEEQKEAVLKYLLKKNKLTLKKAIKEMNDGN